MIDSSVLSLFAPALFACLLISLVNGPLGAEVVRRGIIFIDLAIAHIAGLGFIAGTVLFPDHSVLAFTIHNLFVCVIFHIYILDT